MKGEYEVTVQSTVFQVLSREYSRSVLLKRRYKFVVRKRVWMGLNWELKTGQNCNWLSAEKWRVLQPMAEKWAEILTDNWEIAENLTDKWYSRTHLDPLGNKTSQANVKKFPWYFDHRRFRDHSRLALHRCTRFVKLHTFSWHFWIISDKQNSRFWEMTYFWQSFANVEYFNLLM